MKKKKGPVYAVYSSPSGLVSGGKDGVVRVWNPADNSMTSEIDLKTHPSVRVWQEKGKPHIHVSAFAFDPTNQLLYVGTRQGDIYSIQLDEQKVESITHVRIQFLSKNTEKKGS